jgi:hypothetical protein
MVTSNGRNGSRCMRLYGCCSTSTSRGDAAVVGKQHVRDGVIHLRTEKTGTIVTIAILPELQETLDAGSLGKMCWFAKLDGAPMTKESVGNFFKDRCVMAGIPNKSGHGVRKAAATEAAANGATHAELNSIFGWKAIRWRRSTPSPQIKRSSPLAQSRSCVGPKSELLKPHPLERWEP